jgi:hypothetical protein
VGCTGLGRTRTGNVPEATERLEALSSQISRAAEKYARVVVHGELNLDLDRSGDPLYARKSRLKALSDCTEAAGLETHKIPPTWHSYGLHRGSRLDDRLVRLKEREVADPASEVTNQATDVSDPALEVTNLATDLSDSAREVAAQAMETSTQTTHTGPTLHDSTMCTHLASHTRPPKCWRTTPRTITRS